MKKVAPLYLQQGKLQAFWYRPCRKNLNPLLRKSQILPPATIIPGDAEEFLAAEMIGKRFCCRQGKIPHSTAVEIDSMELREDRDILDVDIHVEGILKRNNHRQKRCYVETNRHRSTPGTGKLAGKPDISRFMGKGQKGLASQRQLPAAARL